MVFTRSQARSVTKSVDQLQTSSSLTAGGATKDKSGWSDHKAAAKAELPIIPFSSAKDFEAFLDAEHLNSSGIWVKFARKGSGIPTITGVEAVEVALCFGWIDGQGKSIDDKYYMNRYTPRRPKSTWSQLNVDRVARLLADDRMRPAGIEAVNLAKSDGRWDRAYARPSDIVVPEDLAIALQENPIAEALFAGLGKGQRYAVLHKIYTASPSARSARLAAIVDDLARGKLPGMKVQEELKAKSSTKSRLRK